MSQVIKFRHLATLADDRLLGSAESRFWQRPKSDSGRLNVVISQIADAISIIVACSFVHSDPRGIKGFRNLKENWALSVEQILSP